MEHARQPRRVRRRLTIVNEDAAGLDVGATFHVVAIPADRDAEPVRTFQSFTADLHALADWLQSVGIRTIAMESTGGLLDSGLRDSGTARVRGAARQCAGHPERSGAQDRCQ